MYETTIFPKRGHLPPQKKLFFGFLGYTCGATIFFLLFVAIRDIKWKPKNECIVLVLNLSLGLGYPSIDYTTLGRLHADLLLPDVASNLSNRCFDRDLHLTALFVGAPAASSAAFEVTNDAYYFLHR